MMRTVAYFTDSTDFGGAEQSLLNLISRLDRARWQPVLIHHPGAGIEPLLAAARRLEVTLLPVAPMPEGREGAPRIPAFVRQLRAWHPDVFHAHLTWPLACKYGLLAATLARVPAVLVTAHLFVELPDPRLVRLKQRFFGAGIQRYVAVSQAVAARLRQTFALPLRKLQVVPNGIAVDAFDRIDGQAVRERLAGGSGKPIVLCVARLAEQKGQRYLIDAAERVPDALFVLAGDGPDRSTLAARIHERHLTDRVLLLGARRDIPALLAACDVFVLPSLWEGLPLAILEAMAARKPVIATQVGGTPEAVIHGESGWLAPPADVGALATALQTLLRDAPLAEKYAAAGRARVEQEFSIETMTRRITRLYDQLLQQGAQHDA